MLLFQSFLLLFLAVFSVSFSTFIRNPWPHCESASIIASNSALESPAPMHGTMPCFVVSTDSPFANTNKSVTFIKTKVLKMLAIINYSQYSAFFREGALFTKGMQLALDRLKLNRSWLPGYDVVLEMIDDEGIAWSTIPRLIKRLEANIEQQDLLPVILSVGIAENQIEKALGEVVKHYNFFSIQYLFKSSAMFYNRKRFSSFFGMTDPLMTKHFTVARLCKELNWHRVAIISEFLPYYDEIEQELVKEFERLNITLAWYGKLPLEASDEEIDNNMVEMARKSPRIVLLHVHSMKIGCMLYKHGFHGPGYIFIMEIYGAINTQNEIPEKTKGWCKMAHIAEIVKSIIYLGGRMEFDSEFRDSTGITDPAFTKELNARIIDGIPAVFFSDRFHAYELVIFAGNVINTAYSMRNASTIDFGPADISTRALFETPKTVGFNGVYKFEATTQVNSKGYSVWCFGQAEFTSNGEFKTRVRQFATFQASDAIPLNINYSKLKWNTKSGQPPPDQPVFQEIEQLLFPAELTWSLIALAGIVDIFLVASIGFVKVKSTFHKTRHFFTKEKYIMMLGCLVLAASLFALPWQPAPSSLNIDQNCTVLSALIIGAYAIINASYSWKLSNFRKKQKAMFLGLWIFVNLALLVVLLSIWPFQTHKIKLKAYSEDEHVIFQPFRYQCGFRGQTTADDNLSNDLIIVIALIFSIQGFSMLRNIFMAYHEMKKPRNDMQRRHYNALATSLYLQLLVMTGCVLIAMILDTKYSMAIAAVGATANSFAIMIPLMYASRSTVSLLGRSSSLKLSGRLPIPLKSIRNR